MDFTEGLNLMAWRTIARLSRRNIIFGILGIAVLVLAGIFILRQQPAVFQAGAVVHVRDADTIEVDGTRIPGGAGLWRYHVHTAHWEKVPSRVVPHLDDLYHATELSERFAVDRGSVIIGLPHRENHPPADHWYWTYHESLSIIQVRLSDGQKTVLGEFTHTSSVANDWDLLPDGSGIWVREERDIKPDWVQILLHLYSFQTGKWNTVYRSACYYNQDWFFSPITYCSTVHHQGQWVRVFPNVEYADATFSRRGIAELWVNLSTREGRLGEPASNPWWAWDVGIAPDGRYGLCNGNILSMPEWPQGNGMVGETYSRARQIGSLPSESIAGSRWYRGLRWAPDSQHLAYENGEYIPCDDPGYDRISRYIERYTPLRFTHLSPTGQCHILDLGGKEIGSIPQNLCREIPDIPNCFFPQPSMETPIASGPMDPPVFIGEYMLTSVRDEAKPNPTQHFFLMSLTGKQRREIMRELGAK